MFAKHTVIVRCTLCDAAQNPFAMQAMVDKSFINGNINMLETIIILLVILWALGLVSSYTMGGFIHILLVVALVIFIIRLIQGRRIL